MNKKKVLLAFFNEFESSKMQTLITMMTDLDVIIVNQYEKALELYKSESFDFIIMDHKTKDGNFFIEDILSLKTQQKIVLISDSLKCPISCDECLAGFRFLRLVKPINYQRLIPYLNDDVFECVNKHRYGKVDTLEKLNELLFLNDYLVYNQKSLENDILFISSKEKSYNENYLYSEYDLIKNVIDNGHFKIKLLDDKSIQIEKI